MWEGILFLQPHGSVYRLVEYRGDKEFRSGDVKVTENLEEQLCQLVSSQVKTQVSPGKVII